MSNASANMNKNWLTYLILDLIYIHYQSKIFYTIQLYITTLTNMIKSHTYYLNSHANHTNNNREESYGQVSLSQIFEIKNSKNHYI